MIREGIRQAGREMLDADLCLYFNNGHEFGSAGELRMLVSRRAPYRYVRDMPADAEALPLGKRIMRAAAPCCLFQLVRRYAGLIAAPAPISLLPLFEEA